jgi:hypothetical protein
MAQEELIIMIQAETSFMLENVDPCVTYIIVLDRKPQSEINQLTLNYLTNQYKTMLNRGDKGKQRMQTSNNFSFDSVIVQMQTNLLDLVDN